MISRAVVLFACLVLAAGVVARADRAEPILIRQTLDKFPLQLEGWQGLPQAPFAKDILDVLGVDDYLTRVYYTPDRNQGAGLYIGYYQTQREGDTIHSPMNCLPGAGWQPVRTDRVDIGIPGRTEPIHVNEVVIEKGLDRQLVLYWYQSRGRVVASEYWSKVFMVTDAIRYNRSDAALVRVVTPVRNSATGLDDARERARAFVQVLFPQLDRHLPS